MSECERCKDSGTVALSTRDSHYRGAGPVPDYAKGVYEGYCDCDLGQQLLREEIAHRQRMDDLVAKTRSGNHG